MDSARARHVPPSHSLRETKKKKKKNGISTHASLHRRNRRIRLRSSAFSKMEKSSSGVHDVLDTNIAGRFGRK